MLKFDAVVHWSIPVNNLDEAEKFYGEILGLEQVGRLATSRMSCYTLGGHNILLCERKDPVVRTVEQDGRLHHAFDVSSEMFNKACKVFPELAIKIREPVDYPWQCFFYRQATLRSRSQREPNRTPGRKLDSGNAQADIRRNHKFLNTSRDRHDPDIADPVFAGRGSYPPYLLSKSPLMRSIISGG